MKPRRPEYNWRCHLFYRTAMGEKEVVFDNVIAADEDLALRVAERMMRNMPQRAHCEIVYAEAVASLEPVR